MSGPGLSLPHGEDDPNKTYTMPDPDELGDAFSRAWMARFSGKHAAKNDMAAVLMMANAYLHLTTYSLGQEVCVGKLRDIWRARRARCKKP